MTTSSPDDDKFSFTLTVNSSNPSAAGGYVNVSINGVNVGGQNIGESKKFLNQYNISGGSLNVVITAGSGSCPTVTTTVNPPVPCSVGVSCIWDPQNVNPSYANVKTQRDCKGTASESDDEVSGTFSVTGIPAGYKASLSRKLTPNGVDVEHIASGLSNGQTVSWGPYNVNSVKYPGTNGFVLWFMVDGISDCMGDYFVTIPDCPVVPCNPSTPSGSGVSVCTGTSATLTASGCGTGYTTTWYSNSSLTTQVGTGNSYTTPVLTATTDYYVSCVKNGDASCKCSGMKVTATVKPLPTLTAGTPTCASNGLTYSVSLTTNGTLSSSAGTVSGSTVSGIPAGTNATITATLNGCSRTVTVSSPTCTIPCTAPTPSGSGVSICTGDVDGEWLWHGIHDDMVQQFVIDDASRHRQ